MPRPARSKDVTYKTAAQAWPRGPRMIILSNVDTEIAKFPLAFLASCGDNTWSYVLYVVSLLVNEDAHHSGSIVDLEGRPVDAHDAPIAGTFRYIEEGESVRDTSGSQNPCLDLFLQA